MSFSIEEKPIKPPHCPWCKEEFEPKAISAKDRFELICCAKCSSVISVITDHSITNSFDLWKIKDKLSVKD